jgi:hypothetical protein
MATLMKEQIILIRRKHKPNTKIHLEAYQREAVARWHKP